MACRVNGHIRGHLTVVTDGHLSHIDNGAVIIGKKILSHPDMRTIVTVKRRIDKSVLRFSEQLLNDPANLLKIRPVRSIQPLKDPSAYLLLLHYRFIGNVGKSFIPSCSVIHLSFPPYLLPHSYLCSCYAPAFLLPSSPEVMREIPGWNSFP